MFNFKNSALRFIKRALNKCLDFCNTKALKAKILNDKKRTALIAVMATLTIAIAVFAANYRVGYTVKVEDVVLGVVATKGEYYEVLDEVKTEVNNISELEFSPITEESFSMDIVSVDSFTEKEELAENVKALSDGMEEAYVITSNGEFVIALHTESDANRVKDEYLQSFYDEKYLSVDFALEVLVTKSHVPADTIKTFEEAESIFSLGRVENYTVTENDTVDAIAELFGVLAEDILKDNEIEELTVGEVLKIYTNKPIIPIKTVSYINGNVEIPFDIEAQEDNTIYKGQKRIKTKGVAGEKYLNAYITEIDGVITEENVIETKIISEPTTQVELVGTKEPPPSVGTGNFSMPTSGKLTSSYGRRWNRNHNGIDVGAKTGTPIYATDNGVVIESEYQSNGYGNIVKIDHQNGYISYYAHCSKLYANVGDVVAKGDLIAAVGNTGRSTGPHLHFEIRYNGIPQNPYDYVK
ncbi:MAG: peptidoglycan DD-metalloendopeptidase family protein [Clostridia bacterium]|nr:peptidoglycan DD-metalloendopeptidase family protein [Clostridia bacterium]